MSSTDAMLGGKSKAETADLLGGGANGSVHALKIKGTIDANPGQHWAGVFFSPGTRPMGPANLSGKSGISFFAKGDGHPAYVMVFGQTRGFVPAIK